jgi:HYR domain
MRPKSVVLAVLLCAVSSIASAATITRISPSVIRFGNVEEFVTLHGTDLVATEFALITITGPAGTFTLEPSAMSPNEMIFFVPEVMLLQEGTNVVTVAFKNLDEPVQALGPFTFSVETIEIFGPPLLSLPEFVLAEAENSDGAEVFFEVDAISQSGDVVDIDCSARSGDFFPIGSTPVQCSATDVNGTTTGEFEVRVIDATPPVLTLPDDFETDDPVVTFEVSAVDNFDGVVPVTCDRQSGSTFPTGVVTVYCEAYDSELNHAFGFFTVTVHGGAPVLTLPEDIFIEATSPAGAVVNYTVTATENGVINCNPPSGSQFPFGPTTVVCTATNNVGSTSGSFLVEVIDGGGPILTLPPDIVAEATSAAGAVVTYTASAVDAVDGIVPVTCAPESGSTFPLGVTIVTCTASDLQLHEVTGTFTVTVRDTTAPQVVSIVVSPDTLWPPDHKMVPVTVTVVAIDAVDDSPVSNIIAVRSNQPLNGTGDGDTAPDWIVTGPGTLQLRAERAGSADRIYTITIDTRDDAGNSIETEVQVKVTQAPRRRSVR